MFTYTGPKFQCSIEFSKQNFCKEHAYGACSRDHHRHLATHRYSIKCYIESEQYGKAEKLCLYLFKCRNHQNHPMLLALYGELLTDSSHCDDKKRLEEGKRYLSKSMNLARHCAYPRYQYARLLCKLNNFSDAKKFYLDALKLSPNDPTINFEYAAMLYESVQHLNTKKQQTERIDESIKYFDRVQWSKYDFASEYGMERLTLYIDALFSDNRFLCAKKILNQIDTNKINRSQRDACRKWKRYAECAIENSIEFGSLIDDSKPGMTECFNVWYKDEDIKIETLINFMNRFNIPFKKLIRFLEKNGNDGDNDGSVNCDNSNTNNNSNDHSILLDELIDDCTRDLKKQECLKLFDKTKQLCLQFGETEQSLIQKYFSKAKTGNTTNQNLNKSRKYSNNGSNNVNTNTKGKIKTKTTANTETKSTEKNSHQNSSQNNIIIDDNKNKTASQSVEIIGSFGIDDHDNNSSNHINNNNQNYNYNYNNNNSGRSTGGNSNAGISRNSSSNLSNVDMSDINNMHNLPSLESPIAGDLSLISTYQSIYNRWIKYSNAIKNAYNNMERSNFYNGDSDNLHLLQCHETMQMIDTAMKILNSDWQLRMKELTSQSMNAQIELQKSERLCHASKIQTQQAAKQLHQAKIEQIQAWNTFEVKRNVFNQLENVMKQRNEAGIKARGNINEFKQLIATLNQCMMNFHAFSQDINHYGPKLIEKYRLQWQLKEKEWYKFTIPELIAWFAFNIDIKFNSNSNHNSNNGSTTNNNEINNTSNNGNGDSDNGNNNNNISRPNINFKTISKNMAKMKFKTHHLAVVTKSDLKEIGYDNDNVCNVLYMAAHAMCDKYPIPKEIDIENDNNSPDYSSESSNNKNDFSGLSNAVIDSKFKCPITNMPMKNPVIAFDGCTYERNNIINYLRQHRKLPNSCVRVPDVENAIQLLFTNQQLQRQIDQWKKNLNQSNNDIKSETTSQSQSLKNNKNNNGNDKEREEAKEIEKEKEKETDNQKEQDTANVNLNINASNNNNNNNKINENTQVKLQTNEQSKQTTAMATRITNDNDNSNGDNNNNPCDDGSISQSESETEAGAPATKKRKLLNGGYA